MKEIEELQRELMYLTPAISNVDGLKLSIMLEQLKWLKSAVLTLQAIEDEIRTQGNLK